MGRGGLMIAAVWLLASGIGTAAAAEPQAGKSVRLLIADDQGTNDCGCYGHPVLKTPHIDALARQGLRFSHAFATTASCSASRSVLYTGLHNHANGQYGLAHAEHHFVQFPQVRSVFELVRDNGYRTGVIGKKHVLPEDKYKVDFEPRVSGRQVKKMAELVGTFLDQAAGRPFFLVVGFVDPHRDRVGFANHVQYDGVKSTPYSPDEVVVPPFLPDEPDTRQELAEYYQSIDRLDQGVGMVLEQLRRAGRDDDTLVIYTSDNGMPFPGAKTTVYEPGLRLPLIVREPSGKRRGEVSDAMVSFVDITPTILEWTGSEEPKYPLHGRSLLEVLNQEPIEGWDEVNASHTFHEITMYYPMRVVRERRYKLIWNIASELPFPFASDLYQSRTWQGILRRGADRMGQRRTADYLRRAKYELYDLQEDPNEMRNLAELPEHAATRQRLAGKLKTFQESTRDPWVIRYEY